ncbi:unnamed protein product [Thelazia callipaeda]|uniref:Uncharacterized protein n=1 Tax=Thelazia callipaeda TaxID=103827 RepID=A0A0N5CMJ9_THECL|nr:unnamed protein product [Thelazia callipaeda]
MLGSGVGKSFINKDSSIQSPISNEFNRSSGFDTTSLFDRIFPFSPLERYKNASLRHMSNGDIGSPTYGIVRNIPIKVENVRVLLKLISCKVFVSIMKIAKRNGLKMNKAEWSFSLIKYELYVYVGTFGS